MRRQTSISTILLRILLLLVFLAGVGYAGYQAFQYWQVRDLLLRGGIREPSLRSRFDGKAKNRNT